MIHLHRSCPLPPGASHTSKCPYIRCISIPCQQAVVSAQYTHQTQCCYGRMHRASLDAQPADGPCACLPWGDSDARRRARQRSHGRSCLVASIIRSSSRSQVSSIHHACTARMAGRQCGAGQCMGQVCV